MHCLPINYTHLKEPREIQKGYMEQESAHHFLSQKEKDDRSPGTRIPASDRQKEIYSTMAMRYPRDVLQVRKAAPDQSN